MAEDPKDVYRVWVPAGQRADAVLRSGSDLVLEPWRPETPSIYVRGAARGRHRLAVSARPGSGPDTVSVRNRQADGVYAYVSVMIRSGATQRVAEYTLELAARR